MQTVQRIRRKGHAAWLEPAECGAAPAEARVALIQALIPPGLEAVAEALEAEVTQLAGARYGRHDARPELVRWGRQRGAVYLADQKVPVVVPRVRDRVQAVERPLATYQQLQQPRALDGGLFRRILGGLA